MRGKRVLLNLPLAINTSYNITYFFFFLLKWGGVIYPSLKNLSNMGDKRVQTNRKDFQVIMDRKDCQIKFRLTEEMKLAIEAIASEKDVSASWVIREAVKEYLSKMEEK